MLQLALSRVPLCVRHVRLWIIQEIVCSGFELELYARHEWTMIYWYLCRVLSTQVALLDELKVSLLREVESADVGVALAYTSFQRDYADALRCFAFAMRNVSQESSFELKFIMNPVTSKKLLYYYSPSRVRIDPSREQANFEKRFKWAFIAGYSEAMTLDEDRPILGKWRRWRNAQEVSYAVSRSPAFFSSLLVCFSFVTME